MPQADATPAPPSSLLEWLALIAIIALGVYVRLDDLQAWWAQADFAFSGGTPLLVNLDGYYFLSLARDLLEGGYDPVDPLRAAPAGAPRPELPPLLSVLTAALATVTRTSPDWVATLLPTLAGPLVALPVHAIARRVAGVAAGLTAALITVLSHYLVFRSVIGFYDTDCLNVFFTMALVWWSLRLPADGPARLGAWLCLGVLLYLAFLWWWTGAWTVVTAIAGWCLLCALGARGWRRRDVVAALATVLALALAALAWMGRALPELVLVHVGNIVSHVTKSDQGDFPNVALSISEQIPASLPYLADKTVGDPVLLAAAALGYGWLALRHRRAGLVLLAPLGLALLSLLFAQRFLIFAAPVTGLGIGYLAARGVAAVGRAWWLRGMVAVGVVAAAGPSLARDVSIDFVPAAGADLVSGMRWVSQNTPPDAVVWALWDYGYTLRYWGRRATVNDGSTHTGELTVYNALPMAAPDFRQAANFMQFYAARGVPGLHRLYAAAGGPGPGLALARRLFAGGPQAAGGILARAGVGDAPPELGTGGWPGFLFPADAPPLYLFLDQRMLGSSYWWYWFGSFDVAAGSGHHGFLRPYFNVARNGPLVRGRGLTVDLIAGTLSHEDEPAEPLSRIVLSSGRGAREQDFRPEGREFHLFDPQALGVHQDQQVARSVFSRAFVLKSAAAPWFSPAHAQSSAFQIWRVRGDTPP